MDCRIIWFLFKIPCKGGTLHPPARKKNRKGVTPPWAGGEVGGTSPPPAYRSDPSYSYQSKACTRMLRRNSPRNQDLSLAGSGLLLNCEEGGGGYHPPTSGKTGGGKGGPRLKNGRGIPPV